MNRTRSGTASVALVVLALFALGVVAAVGPAAADGPGADGSLSSPLSDASDDRTDSIGEQRPAPATKLDRGTAASGGQSNGAEVEVVASDESAKPGEKVTVEVDLESTSTDRHLISQYELQVDYDEDVLTFADATPLELTDVDVTEESGSVTLDREWSPSITTWTDFTALELEFVVVGESGAESDIGVTASEVGSLATNYQTTATDGTVTVGESDGDDGSGSDGPDTGTVTGTITDESGSALEGATVEVGGESATTGSDGSYEIEADAGPQPVRVDADGYQVDSTFVSVPAGNSTSTDVQLQSDPQEAVLGIVGESQVANPGETVTIPIEAVRANGKDQDTLGYEIVFEYDSDVLNFEQATGADYGVGSTDTSSEDTVVVQSRNPLTSNTVPFTGLELQFEVVGDAGTDATIEIPTEVTNDQGETKYPGFGNEVGAERSLRAYHVDSTIKIVNDSVEGGSGDDGSSGGDDGDDESDDGDDTETGTITGTVTDADGDPIRNAQVVPDSGGASDRTDGGGEYKLSLEPGEYELEADATGYETATTLVEVEADATVETDFELESTGALVNIDVGNASGGQGARVSVPVEVEDLNAGDRKAYGHVFTVEYDPDVVKFLDAKAAGFEPTDVNREWGEDDEVVVNSTEGTAQLAPPFTATKLGFELIGDPGETATISLVEERDGRQVSGVGKAVESPWPSTFEGGTITVTDEEADTNTGTVEGTVTDADGNPVEGISVNVADAFAKATTDENGEYSLSVSNGTQEVTFSGDVYVEQTKEVTVETDETTTLDATLEELDRDVDIIVNGTTAPPGGQAVVDLEVEGVDSPDALVRGYGIMLSYNASVLEFAGTTSTDEMPLETTDVRKIREGLVLLNSTRASTETRPPFTAAKVVFDVVGEDGTNATVGLIDEYDGTDVSTLGKTRQVLYDSGLVNGTVTVDDGAESADATVSDGGDDGGSALGSLIVDLGFLVGASGFFGALSVLALGVVGRFDRE